MPDDANPINKDWWGLPCVAFVSGDGALCGWLVPASCPWCPIYPKGDLAETQNLGTNLLDSYSPVVCQRLIIVACKHITGRENKERDRCAYMTINSFPEVWLAACGMIEGTASPHFLIFAILPPRHITAKRAYPGYTYQCGACRAHGVIRLMRRDAFEAWKPTSTFGQRQKRERETGKQTKSNTDCIFNSRSRQWVWHWI